MAVLPMKRIYLGAMQADRKQIMEELQRKGVVELSSSDATYDETIFSTLETDETVDGLTRELQETEDALKILQRYRTDKPSLFASLEGKEIKTTADYNAFYDEKDRVLHLVSEIRRLQNENLQIQRDSERVSGLQEELVPWLNLEVPLQYRGTSNTICYIGSVRGEHTNDSLYQMILEQAPELTDVFLTLISQFSDQTNLMIIGLRKEELLLKKALDYIGFSFPIHQGIAKTPIVLYQDYQQQKVRGAEIAAENKETLKNLAEHSKKLEFLADHNRVRIEKYKALSQLTVSKHTFFLEGYLPADQADSIIERFTNDFTCMVSVRNITKEDDPPTQLKNSWFSEPVESVVNDYGKPNYWELDPTTVMSFFYYVLFGMMFSDAGYGLVLAAVCGGLLLQFKNMETSMSKTLRMFFWCGISTIFWGMMFSSYFGDVVTVVASNFFGRVASIPPLWFSPLDNPMKLLIFCLGLGILHLTAGYVMNAANAIRNKDFGAVVFDCIFPVFMLFGLLPTLMSSDMFMGMAGFQLSLSPQFLQGALIVSGVSCLGIVLTGGRESRAIGKRLAKGAYSLYNTIAGWLSDILSYSRLLALGLATGVIASVINMLGGMLGKGIVGAIGFIIVFVLGHAMNFGINILGSYVHSNRLEYVEFFGKFYDGGGRKFAPFGINTQFYKIKED